VAQETDIVYNNLILQRIVRGTLSDCTIEVTWGNIVSRSREALHTIARADSIFIQAGAMKIDGSNLVGKVLGTCSLENLIGRGGMSVVYLARQAHPARYVAVKVLRPPHDIGREDYNAFLARFQREADIVARLEHVNIVPIFEYGEQDQLTYLVMPYVSGGSLSQLLAKQGKFSLHQSLNYIQQATAALDYAHARGVIHRDLKPGNFLAYPDGRLVLADFGIARIVGGNRQPGVSTLTLTGAVVGTPAYMAPEMLRGEPLDAQTDIYSLGIVLFQMLSGDLPFRGDNPYVMLNKQLQEFLPSLHAVDPAIPPAVDAVVQKATAKRIEDRYASAGALAQAFRAAIQTSGAITYRNTPILPSSPPPLEPLLYKSPPPVAPSINPAQKPVLPASEFWSSEATLPASAVQPTPRGSMPSTPKGRSWPMLLKTLPILALLIAALLVSLRIGGVFAGHFQPSPTNTPTVTPILTPTEQAKMLVQQYYDNINKQDYSAAYDLLTSRFQQSLPYNTFSSGYAQDLRDDITFNNITENADGSVTVRTFLRVLRKDSTTKNYLWTGHVVQQPGGVWKIDSATIQKI
jgi:serine/threonine protein kinase